MATPTLPYIIYGTAPYGNIILNFQISSSYETLIATTNSAGQFVFDLANFALAWGANDTLKIWYTPPIPVSNLDMYIAIDGDETSPTWQLIENNTRTTLFANQTKTKIDEQNYSGGRQAKTIVKEA